MQRFESALQEVAIPELVNRALDGDEAAWTELVLRLRNVIWREINRFDLSPTDQDESFAATVYRLREKLRDVREPARLPGWIATTARNEVLGLLRERSRQEQLRRRVPAEPPVHDHAADLVHDELLTALRAAFARLEPKDRQFLEALTSDPPMTYDDISVLFEIPVPSIGPTRQRCLQKLRNMAPLAGYLAAGGDA